MKCLRLFLSEGGNANEIIIWAVALLRLLP